MDALRAHKFVLPSELALNSESIRWASNLGGNKHYDQIAFRVREGELELGPSANNAGVVNYYDAVFRDDEAEDYYSLATARMEREGEEWIKYYSKEWRTWQMSDHLPLFVELQIDFTERYLERIRDA